MLEQFAKRVADKSGKDGAFDWESIFAIVMEMLAKCLDNPSALKSAIDSPSPLQRIGLRLRCRSTFGWRTGDDVARVIVSEAKPFREELSTGLPKGQSFEEALLAEGASLSDVAGL